MLAIVTEPKDRPLILRERKNGDLELDSDEFPPRHEFGKDWLLEHTLDGTVAMSADAIRLTLANARAIYEIDRSLMEQRVEVEDEDGNVTVKVHKLSAGYWGVLVESEVRRKDDDG